MPTFPGSILPGATRQEPPSWPRSPEISEREAVAFPFDPSASSVARPGARLDTQPVDEPRLGVNGARLPAFGADWYHRIHAVSYTHLTLPTKRIV